MKTEHELMEMTNDDLVKLFEQRGDLDLETAELLERFAIALDELDELSATVGRLETQIELFEACLERDA